MIESYLGEEMLEYHCDFCKIITQGKKKVEFQELPENVIFSFNRYLFAEGNHFKSFEKIELEYEITIPVGAEMERFELYAVIVHIVDYEKYY
jgi:uncharacterized UBP type Zn finger protein